MPPRPRCACLVPRSDAIGSVTPGMRVAQTCQSFELIPDGIRPGRTRATRLRECTVGAPTTTGEHGDRSSSRTIGPRTSRSQRRVSVAIALHTGTQNVIKTLETPLVDHKNKLVLGGF